MTIWSGRRRSRRCWCCSGDGVSAAIALRTSRSSGSVPLFLVSRPCATRQRKERPTARMTIYDDLATPICVLVKRLPRIQAPIADYDEIDVLCDALVALYHQVPPRSAVGDNALYYWEDRIALALVMVEALEVLTLRQRDPIVLACYDDLSQRLAELLTDTRRQRQQVQYARFKKTAA